MEMGARRTPTISKDPNSFRRKITDGNITRALDKRNEPLAKVLG